MAGRPAEAKASPVVFGIEGLLKLHYLGFEELAIYRGQVTGKAYQFGMVRMYGYVDTRDVHAMLDTLEDGQKVFEIWRS